MPAGYITCRILYTRYAHRITSYKGYLFWGLSGAVIPDLDYYYMLLFDPSGAPDHHYFFTHYPLFWALLWGCSLLWLGLNRRDQNPVSALLFSLGGFIHTILDTVIGRIYWLAPFMDKKYGIVSLVYRYDPSRLPDFWNWGYGVEVLIILWAVYLWLRDDKRKICCR